jgi:hypothetical protein
VPQVLCVAEAFSKHLPGVGAHPVVNKSKGHEHGARGNLLGETNRDLGVDLRVLRNDVFVVGRLGLGRPYRVVAFGISCTLRIGVFDVLPDGDTGLVAKLFEVFAKLIGSFLQFTLGTLVREDKHVLDQVDATENVRGHFKVI